MPFLVLDGGHPDQIRLGDSEVDDIRESSHQCPADISFDYHPSRGHESDALDLLVELLEKLPAQSRHAFVVEITNFGEFEFDRRVMLDSHGRNRRIISS
jgi:hypothetical protein